MFLAGVKFHKSWLFQRLSFIGNMSCFLFACVCLSWFTARTWIHFNAGHESTPPHVLSPPALMDRPMMSTQAHQPPPGLPSAGIIPPCRCKRKQHIWKRQFICQSLNMAMKDSLQVTELKETSFPFMSSQTPLNLAVMICCVSHGFLWVTILSMFVNLRHISFLAFGGGYQ